MFKFIILSVVSASLLFAEFTFNEKGIITDEVNGLQWQAKYSDTEIRHLSFSQAIDYCQALELDGMRWRIPNKNELLSIIDYAEFNPSTYEVFKNSTRAGKYWTSTSHSSHSANARYFDFKSGVLEFGYKRNKANVRCVRDKQL